MNKTVIIAVLASVAAVAVIMRVAKARAIVFGG